MTKAAGTEETTAFTGVIVKGRGRASTSLQKLYPELRRITGREIVPGSLNLVLREPVKLDPGQCILEGRIGKLERFFWQARVNGRIVYVYRWRGAPLHVMEILSDVYLREAFGLESGDALTIDISSRSILPLSDEGHLFWKALWMHREESFYSSDELNEITKTVLKKYRRASTQRQTG